MVHYGVFQLVSVIVVLISLLASLSLLTWVWRLSKPVSKKLMARQLFHLALADALQSSLISVRFVLELLHTLSVLGSEPEWSRALCSIGYADRLPLMTSMLVEVHIALATVCCICHWPTALAVLSKTVPLLWVPGCVLGAIVFYEDRVSWDRSVGVCNPLVVGERLLSIVLVGAAVVCIVAYLAGIAQSWRVAAGPVQDRRRSQAQMFVMAAVLSWLPYVVFAFTQWGRESRLVSDDGSRRNKIWYITSSWFSSLNGLLNAVVYAYKSGSFRRTLRRQGGNSGNVNVRSTGESLPTVGGSEAPNSGRVSHRMSAAHSSRISFEVAFKTVAEVFAVSARTTERQTEVFDMSPQTSFSLFHSFNSVDEDFLECFDMSPQTGTFQHAVVV